MKCTVLSDGAWGSALAMVLAGNGHEVVVWGPFADYIEQLKNSRVNSRFLPGVVYPESVKFESDMELAVAGSELILLATPTQFARSVVEKFKPFFKPDEMIILDVAKGIENNTLMHLSEMCTQVIGQSRYVVMSGPSHAEEVSRRVPTAVVAASADPEACKTVQQLFCNEYFRVYTGSDVLGVELGGALKNIMAIAAGIIDGMQLGDNPKAAMMTRAIAEMSRLGEALGGNAATFSGLSGVGDLIVTCCSGHSRNRHVGEELGRGKKLSEILAAMGMVVAEGVATTKSAFLLARRLNVDTPIINQMYEILYDEKDPRDTLRELMLREPKAE